MSRKYKPGDLVEVGGIWNMRGIVLADSSAWWVISGHYDISHCIVAARDIKRFIERSAVRPDLLPFLATKGVSNASA
jgi:hypothetical protein